MLKSCAWKKAFWEHNPKGVHVIGGSSEKHGAFRSLLQIHALDGSLTTLMAAATSADQFDDVVWRGFAGRHLCCAVSNVFKTHLGIGNFDYCYAKPLPVSNRQTGREDSCEVVRAAIEANQTANCSYWFSDANVNCELIETRSGIKEGNSSTDGPVGSLVKALAGASGLGRTDSRPRALKETWIV